MKVRLLAAPLVADSPIPILERPRANRFMLMLDEVTEEEINALARHVDFVVDMVSTMSPPDTEYNRELVAVLKKLDEGFKALNILSQERDRN